MRATVSYKRATPLMLAILLPCLGSATRVATRPTHERPQLRPSYEEIDRVGDIDGTANPPAKAMQDTIWIADWSFDAASGACTLAGWTSVDNRILALADPDTHWQVNSNFSGVGNIIGDAASVGGFDLCSDPQQWYGNNWYNAIRMEYSGTTFLSFDFLIESEGGLDFLQVEEDSACASFNLVDYTLRPDLIAADFRGPPIWQTSGLITNPGATTHVASLALTNFGPGTHCVYISFISDNLFLSDAMPVSTLGVAAVVDNITLEGGTTFLEPFTGGITNPTVVSFVSLQDTEPFGTWTRTFLHITDNDLCTENQTCALLSTDDTTPTTAVDLSMAFGPSGFVIRNWLDDILVSPWVSLASTPGAVGTPITFRRFPGNNFGDAKIVANWSVRGVSRVDNTDSSALGDSIDCISPWEHADRWNSLSFFGWTTLRTSMERDFPSASTDIQIRLRTSDWQYILGSSPPAILNPGPGPYHDRVRIGRVILTGPVMDEGIDARFQAQDAFATDRVFWSGPPTQESFAPCNTRFGTVAFSRGVDHGQDITPNLVTGDSITMNVTSIRSGNFTIISIDVYGAIVEGPHVGQAPPGLSVGPSGFFIIPADSARDYVGSIVMDRFSVDFDDDYFMPGDVLHYFWLAGDSGGGFTSDPVGLTAPPTSLAHAQDATQGMFEVSFLPKINWDTDIVAAAQTGANGKIQQTQLDSPPAEWVDEFAGALGEQANCILYYQQLNTRRRTGEVNRTTFMYTLDALGYRGSYDVYDHQGFGNTNNQLGGRANVSQALGYALIIYDAGNSKSFLMPNGLDLDAEKIHQADWYSAYLAAGLNSEIGIANLWIISSNLMELETLRGVQPLVATDMGVSLAAADQGLSINPDVDGVATMNYTTSPKDYTADLWSVQGGCPTIRNYDALTPIGTAVMTHAWAEPDVPANPATANAAIVQKANVAAGWNAILMAFPLFDMRDKGTGNPRKQLVLDVLTSLVPLGCQEAIDPVDTVEGDIDLDLPKKFALNRVYPNPFNPITTIAFDVPQVGGVELKVYDVVGRLVKTLWTGQMEPGFGKSITWNGLDNQGHRASSGVYFVRMKAADFSATTKIVMMK